MFGRAEQYHFRPLENANDYRNELRLLATLIDGCNINPAIGVRLRQIADAVVAVVAPREGTEGQ